jgi:hypothetical protein
MTIMVRKAMSMGMVAGLMASLPVGLALPFGLEGQEPTRVETITEALSAGPPELREAATVLDGDGTVLREGTNGWTCVALPGNAMCVDEHWLGWLDAYMHQRAPERVDGVGIAYMLRGDTGASNINPFDEGPTPDNDWVRTGAHLMLIVPDAALLDAIPADHTTGGPWVMWKGHPLAHVMIPLGGGR